MLLVPLPSAHLPQTSSLPHQHAPRQANTDLVSLVTVSAAIYLFHSVITMCATCAAGWLFFCDPTSSQISLPTVASHG